MHRLTAERPDPWTEGGARTGHESTITEDLGVRDSTPKTAVCPSSRTDSARKTLRTTIVVGLGLALLSAAIVAVGIVADHLPNIVLGLCLIVLGIVCGAMLAVKA